MAELIWELQLALKAVLHVDAKRSRFVVGSMRDHKPRNPYLSRVKHMNSPLSPFSTFKLYCGGKAEEIVGK